MRPILFSLGSLNFYSYGFFTAVGFIVAGVVIDFLARKKKLITTNHREYFLLDALLASLVVGVVTARISFILLYGLIFRTSLVDLSTNIFGGGFIFYPGFLCGGLIFVWWMHNEHDNLLTWLDILMTGLFIGLAISQIGGYLNDGQIYHLGGLFGNSLLAGTMYHLLIYKRKNPRIFALSLFSLFLLSFFLGFWQTETVQWLGLNLGQWVSLLALVVTGYLTIHSTQSSN